MIGTPYYMSPELFSNTVRAHIDKENARVPTSLSRRFLSTRQPYNYKSDVWSFGCCAYEMATLTQAFNARDLNALAYRVLQGKVSSIAGLLRHITRFQVARLPAQYSDNLDSLVGSMLRSDPEQRPSVAQILKLPFIRESIAGFLAQQQQTLSCVWL